MDGAFVNGQYDPAGHSVQAEASVVVEYDPAVQLAHTLSVVLVQKLTAYVPGAQVTTVHGL
jgi:hypothetical protein